VPRGPEGEATRDPGGGDQYDGRVPPGSPIPATPASAPTAAPSGGGPAAPGATALPVPPAADTWVDLSTAPLSVGPVAAWAGTPEVGAVVTFSGTARDHAEGRDGVTSLTYEAYATAARARMAEVVADTRRRWPQVRRVAALHRTGRLVVGDVAVVVAVSAPHRGPAFAAAAHCIDTLKATVPLWKREAWTGGEDWGTDATPIDHTTPAPEASATS